MESINVWLVFIMKILRVLQTTYCMDINKTSLQYCMDINKTNLQYCMDINKTSAVRQINNGISKLKILLLHLDNLNDNLKMMIC